MANLRLLIIIVLSFISLSSFGQASKNVSFVGKLTYNQPLKDVWGYVDGNGDEYALVGLENGVSIVGLSDPAQPNELHYIPGVGSNWRDLKTWQNFAYISNEDSNGITIIDLSGLPGAITSKDTIIDQIETAHNLYIDDGMLFVVGYNGEGGIKIFDIATNPMQPTLLGTYNTNYVHDVYVRNDLAYSAEISAGLLTIIDISTPSTPTILGSIDYPGSFTHNTWLNDAGDVCFTTDELPAAYITAWDVSDPSDIKFLDRIRSSVNNEESSPHNVHVLNDYLVSSYYADGLHIVDASRPHNLVEVGFYDSSPLADGSFEGVWGAYPFLPSGNMLASDQQEGLFILKPDFIRGCYLEGTVRDLETMAPIANVQVCFQDSPRCEFSLTTGSYATGIADSGTYEVIFSKYGYVSDTAMVTLDNGVLVQQDMNLEPLPRTPFEVNVIDKTSQQAIPNAQVRAIADQKAAIFDFSTNNDGKIQDNRFVINSYQIIIGKWGYISRDTTLLIDSTNNTLTIELEKGYYDDFALDFDWQVIGDAERGIWEKGEPVGTYRKSGDIYNPEFDIDSDISDEAYVTGNSGGAPFGDDVDNGRTWLISPSIDLSDYVEPVLQYHWWFLSWSLNGSAPDGPGNDSLRVFVSDGTDTVLLASYTGPYDTTWTQATNHFVNLIDTSKEVKFLFYTHDLEKGNQDAVEAGIDGFQLVEASTLSTEKDFIDYGISLFPNPLQKSLTLQINNFSALRTSDLNIELYDLQGRRLINQHINFSKSEITIPDHLVNGMYIAILKSDGRVIHNQKLMKR